MARSYEDTLAEALAEMAEEAPALRPLSPIVRQRVREGRRRTVVATVAAAVGICAAGAATIVGVSHVAAGRQPSSPEHAHSWSADTSGGVDAMAVGPKELYLATGSYPNAKLSAYSLTTGALVRTIRVPGTTSALQIGPSGSVWLTFLPDQSGGGTGVWLLSPDLQQRSSAGTRVADQVGLTGLVPLGQFWAMLDVNSDLSMLTLPEPGASGSVKLQAFGSTPSDGRYTYAQALASVGSRFAVLQMNGTGQYRVALTGSQPTVTYPIVTGMEVKSMTSDGSSLWLAEEPQLNGPYNGAVVRLNGNLQVVTPEAIANNHLLRFPEQIWTSGDTVVASTDGPLPFVCFRSTGGGGAVTKIPVSPVPADLAVSGRYIYATSPSHVTVYPIPAACQ